MSVRTDVLIVGGGLVGLAAAYKVLRSRPGCRVMVVEKEPEVARHQSGRNSGVLHAGLAYAPGSAKARLATAGVRQMTDFCLAHDIPHEVCGKLVVASTASEVPRLTALRERGQANGLNGLEMLSAEQLREIEPHARGVAALRVPQEGIVDFPAVARALVSEVRALGGEVRTGARLTALRRAATTDGAAWVAETDAGAFEADTLVNCAGLYSDRVARLAGERPAVRIVPFRGEYFRLRDDRASLVRHLIYPAPDPALPFLGVHFTRMIGGGVACGPNAVLALAREGYGWGDADARDMADAVAFPGLWRFLARHPRGSAVEVWQSVSRRAFTRALQRLVPEVRTEDLVAGGSGVRAMAMRPDGELVHDFVFLRRANALHVLNAPSPGATASLAIGDEIVAQLATVRAA